MNKLFFTIIFTAFFVACANANTLDFTKSGDVASNQILKDYVLSKDIIDENTQVVSYFADINDDGEKEIFGIVKSQYFYSLAGYKLFVLKKNSGVWESFKSDIYFDNTLGLKFDGKKIVYYKTVFYKNKKHTAYIKKNKIVTANSFIDCFSDKKAHDIEEITKFSEGRVQNNFELENFHAQNQKNVNINYKNLNDRTKHYLDLK